MAPDDAPAPGMTLATLRARLRLTVEEYREDGAHVHARARAAAGRLAPCLRALDQALGGHLPRASTSGAAESIHVYIERPAGLIMLMAPLDPARPIGLWWQIREAYGCEDATLDRTLARLRALDAAGGSRGGP